MCSKNGSLSDSQILELVLRGQNDAYSLIVERYEDKLMRYALFILKDYDVASDITQETFIKAYIKLRSFNTNKQFSPWVYRILHNNAMNYIKRSKKTSSLGAVSEVDDNFLVSFKHDKTMDRAMMDKRVRSCLGKLDVKYREVIMLSFFENLKYDEISDVLHIPKSTVGVRIRRAKMVLKKVCEQEGVTYG
ncbi:RNA polymerase sigma factor [Candidatus Saccharibacteria bacterium]|nr:RNA polymerase sigma factor [Candidatus Saccharibacteria bacterium]